MSFLTNSKQRHINGKLDENEDEKEESNKRQQQTNENHLIELNHTKRQIQIEEFQTELNHNLIKFRNENLFTDIFIYVEGVEFPCHKVILCASSSYFKAMFSCDLKESRLGKVFIENISSWTMKRLLDFIYTGKIEINYENVIDIFNAAAMFQLYKLADKCTDYIGEHIDLSNCVEIHVFASLHQLEKLEKDTFQFILDNFMQLINSPPTIPISVKAANFNSMVNISLDDINVTNQLLNSVNSAHNNETIFFSDFVLLNEQNFQVLIKSDLLNVSREIYVYYAVKKWIDYQILLNNAQKTTNSLKLMKTYENLFKYIRLNALTRDEIDFILTNDKLVNSNQALFNQLKSFLDDESNPSSKENEELDFGNINLATSSSLSAINPVIDNCANLTSNIRPSTIPREYLCLLQSDQFQYYDFYKSKWDNLSSWPPQISNSNNKSVCLQNNFTLLPLASRQELSNLNGYSTCIVNNILYVIGGYVNRIQLVDYVWRFDPIKNEWSNCKPMLRKRAFHLSISLVGTSSPSPSTSQPVKESNFIFLFYGICLANQTNDTLPGPIINTGSSLLTQCLIIDYYNIETDQWTALNVVNNNSLLNHHIFQSINNQNRSIHVNNRETEGQGAEIEHEPTEQETAELNSILNQLIEHQLAQSKTIVSLKNLIYILKENCINCYEFDSNLEQLVCLPYFRLPTNLSSFSFATAFPVKITSSSSSSSATLFSWYSDNEESTSLLSSPQVAHCNRNLETSLKKSSSSENHIDSDLNNVNNKDEDSDENEPKSSNQFYRSKKEALIYLINAQKRILYEFYPAKNKLKKLPNLLLKHSSNETFVISIKSKLYVTGGILENETRPKIKQSTNLSSDENYQQQRQENENPNAIEVLNEEKDCWSIFKNNLATISNDNQSTNQSIQMTKHFFKLKMSLA